jgi:N12 class adenine-specific DNA methylase
VAKAHANLAALRTLRALEADGRGATEAERATLGHWSGWGAIAEVFDPANQRWAALRSELRQLLDDQAWTAAERTTINAHYTSAEVVQAMWRAVADLGFAGGRVLEPGCGSGNFLGFAPMPIEAVGVELDPTTAAIARALYPSAQIRTESFADTRLPPGHFGLTIGNVPFGKLALHDPTYNPGRASIHNHFIIKSLHLTQPGGLVAVITSRFTLDARDPGPRREMAALADLVGAVRLPEATFRASSGTDVVVDLLVLRRRLPGDPANSETWATLSEVDTPDGEVAINEYLARHRDLILGELRATSGQYNEADVTVRPTGALAPALDSALTGVTDRARASALLWTPAPAPSVERADQATLAGVVVGQHHHEGSILRTPGGGFAKVHAGVARPFDPKPRSDSRELAALVDLRDALMQTLEAQASSRDDAAFADAQRLLNVRYDAYRAHYGPLNRFRKVRTGRRDPETGEELLRRINPRMGGFGADPDFFSVMALERFDPDSQQATKAAIFAERVVALRQPPLGAETAQDALAICLDTHGRVELDTIAALLGVARSDARTELGTLVYDDPSAPDTLVTASAYLSGNVRAKLAAAEAAATANSDLEVNVAALRAVLPADLGAEDIDARLGAPWIGADDVVAFARETLGSSSIKVGYSPTGSVWGVTCPSWERGHVRMTSTWGTRRADAIALLQHSLEQRPVSVYDAHADGTRSVNPEETLAAREKQDALELRFRDWVWEDQARAQRLAARYNELFNSTVLPAYDGSHLSTPGLAADFRPRPHQLDAVWRILSEPTVLLAHCVGAGKTAVMVMAGMEMRRLGLVRRPCYVVPNHMLEQFSREFLQLYPRARVLVADKDDVGKSERKSFVAKCAMGDWDAVVISHTSFKRIPVSAATQAQFLDSQMADYRAAIAASTEGGGMTVKRLQTALARLEERHKALLNNDGRDDGVSWDQTGVDYICCDEAQAHKNLAFPSHVQGVGGKGSQLAEDMALKLHCLRQRNGARVATFATATPISNTLAEMYVMQTYLQPEALAAAGITAFDAWAATFGRTVTTLELAPDGGSYRLQTRFAKFANVPELVAMFRAIADVRTADQLGLPAPQVRAETVVVPASDGLERYVQTLVERAERIRNKTVKPDEDMMLLVCNDGRKAALDLRLVGEPPDPDGGKIAAAAERIAGIWRANADRVYVGDKGQPEARRGALQLVFCDLSVPRPGWNAYDELRDRLAARGVPADQVRFIHDAGDNDRAKAELFEACRSGRVAVLIGSTQKMGVGTNVQRRAIALHDLDAPWKPAEIEQRRGRIVRQGNQNPEVEILRYVTEGSFDVYMWQTLERKAGFIHQVTQGEAVGREVDDVGEQALSFAEVKALATGNPLILERAGLENDIAKLDRLARAHHREQRSLLVRQREAAARAEVMDHKADLCDAALGRRVDTRGDRFAMTVEGVEHRSRVDAAVRLRQVLLAVLEAPPPKGTISRVDRVVRVAQVGGFGVDVDVISWPDGRNDATMRLEQLPVKSIPLERREVHQGDPTGLVARLENRIHKLEETGAGYRAEASASRNEGVEIVARIGRPFEYQARLEAHRIRLRDIEEQLTPDEAGGASPGPIEPGPAADRRPSPATISPPALTARLSPPPETPAANPEAAEPSHPVHPTAVSTPQAGDTDVVSRTSPPPSVLRGPDRLSVERAALETELAKLAALAAAHREKSHRLDQRKAALMSEAATIGKMVRRCEAALEQGVDTAGGRFVWTVIDAPNYRATEFRSRDEASQQLRLALLSLVDQQHPTPSTEPAVHTELVGRLCSFRVEADISSWSDGRTNIDLRVDNLPLEPVRVELAQLTTGNPVEVVTALESRIATIAETAANYRAEELVLRDQEARIAARVDQPFEYQPRLDTLRGRLRDIEDLLGPPETAEAAPSSPMASIRRLPRRPQPDDPVTVTDYDDCPICLSSDLRSTGDGLGEVRCKECGWVGSYPPHPHLRLVQRDPAEATEVDADIAASSVGPGSGVDHVADPAIPTTSTSTSVPATQKTPTELPGPNAATPTLPSIHQQHQLHQQLYPAPHDPGPIVQA